MNGQGGLLGVHHIGISVRDVDEAASFWLRFLGVEPEWRERLDGPYLGGVTGYPGVEIEAAIFELPGGVILEILDYQVDGRIPNPPETANPGNVHICIESDDIAAMRARAISAGALPVSESVIEVTTGPNSGAMACYLRDPDGITLELFQSPSPGTTAKSDQE